MSKIQKDKLVLLISTMTASEKRSFRIYVNKNNYTGETLYVLLFDFIEKEKHYDPNAILRSIPKIKKSQLSNLKANLFQQILACLRQIRRKSIAEFKVREMIDFAKILYDKGMYKNCLELLEKAKKLSKDINYETLTLSILYFQKRIEAQHVTGSMGSTANELSRESNLLLENIELTNTLSNLSLLLYGEYLKFGYVRNQKDFQYVTQFFERHKPNVRLDELSFYQSLYLIQSHVWMSNMTHNFLSYYKYAQRWVDLFENRKELQFSETPLYLKGLHNLLNALFMVQNADRFETVLFELEEFNLFDKPNVTKNDISLWVLIRYIHKLNHVFITGEFSAALSWLPELEQVLVDNTYNWDLNRYLVFQYKIACVYFGADDLDKALDFLNQINNNYYPNFREDIQCFSRILALVAHFDLGNVELVNYQLKNVMRFLMQQEDLEKVQQEILKFLRRTPKMKEKEMNKEFSLLKDKLVVVRNEQFEKRPFFYFDIISWLESKIESTPIQETIQRNNKLLIKNRSK